MNVSKSVGLYPGTAQALREVESRKKEEGKEGGRVQIPIFVYDRSRLVDSCFRLIEKYSGNTLGDLEAQLAFYFEHKLRSLEPKLTLASLTKVNRKIEQGEYLEVLATESIKVKLDLNPKALLKIKDETSLSDKGIEKWIQVLQGLTCSLKDLKTHENAVNKQNEEAKSQMATLSILIALLSSQPSHILKRNQENLFCEESTLMGLRWAGEKLQRLL